MSSLGRKVRKVATLTSNSSVTLECFESKVRPVRFMQSSFQMRHKPNCSIRNSRLLPVAPYNARRMENTEEQSLPVEKSDARAERFDEDEYPPGTTRFECQVAGHAFDPKKNKIGMLRGKNGQVLKSCEKPVLQEREIAFYEAIENSDDPLHKELSLFAPKYFGTLETTYKNKPIKFLVLKDTTEGMAEPCVMDVKIGKRTWDPLAGPEKRQADDRKYAASKIAYGFCIPGFQVYDLASGQLRRYNKEYMKKLDADGVIEALKIFLNVKSSGTSPNRELIVNVLSCLWKILSFFRVQKKLRFYASSLLIVYDARRLRDKVEAARSEKNALGLDKRAGKIFSSCDTGLSGHLTSIGPAFDIRSKNVSRPSSVVIPTKSNRVRAIDRLQHRLKRSTSLTGFDLISSSSSSSSSSSPPLTLSSGKIERSGSYDGRPFNETNFSPLCRTHSFTNNYDRDIMEMKKDYAAVLDTLVKGKARNRRNWVAVNMIDFTHVFDAEDDSLDTNYLEGIQNLVEILETFLD